MLTLALRTLSLWSRHCFTASVDQFAVNVLESRRRRGGWTWASLAAISVDVVHRILVDVGVPVQSLVIPERIALGSSS